MVPEQVWQAAYNADGAGREGADVTEFTDLLTQPQQTGRLPAGDAGDRPAGTSPPGAQLRFDDVQGYRLTAFVTNTVRGNWLT